jgi:uncharacterized protein
MYATVETFTGQFVDLLDPQPDTICIEDIAWSLSGQVRWNAHGALRYTVADHSIACAEYAAEIGALPRMQLECLMHDAAEAYIGDVVMPLKHIPAIHALIKPIEHRIQKVLWKTLTGFAGIGHRTAVKEIDQMMLLAEARAFMPSRGKYIRDVDMIDTVIKADARARGRFLLLFKTLLKECKI